MADVGEVSKVLTQYGIIDEEEAKRNHQKQGHFAALTVTKERSDKALAQVDDQLSSKPSIPMAQFRVKVDEPKASNRAFLAGGEPAGLTSECSPPATSTASTSSSNSDLSIAAGPGIFPPGDATDRINYLKKHDASLYKDIYDSALNNDSKIKKIFDQISAQSSPEERSVLLKKLTEQLNKKHGTAYGEAKKVFAATKDQEVYGIINEQVGSLTKQIRCLEDGRTMITGEQARIQFGLIDAIFTMQIDLAHIMNGKLLPSDISKGRYRKIVGCFYRSFGIDEKETEKGSFKPVLVECIECGRTEKANKVKGIFNLFQIELARFMKVKRVHFGVYSDVSKESAEKLKEYLDKINVYHLFSPKAGSGYISSRLINSSIPVTSYDPFVQKITFAKVDKLDYMNAVDKYVMVLSGLNIDILNSAMLIVAPYRLSRTKKNGKRYVTEAVNVFLPRVLKCWFDKGGKKVIIMSPAVGEEQLFSPDKMKQASIKVEPVLPGFSSDIYKGFEEFNGVCGVYEILADSGIGKG
ncbi:hypothetical protein [Endozoicomonas sp.]|uniref:hypothetical protein n=1 Tax=Endozoicomonas sp. TaxID=1892382 RepID=UPI0028838131|nr:hypothetical protein [Endozoicomonas sp.]